MAEATARAGLWVDSSELAARLAQDLTLRPINSTTMELDISQPPTPDGTGRPENFRIIAPGIYRSSYPQSQHFQTLVDLDLKTIITLVSEPLSGSYANFISSNGIMHHQIPIVANKDPAVYTLPETVHKVLNQMLNPENYPMLIHCNKGKHRTGCMIACFRKVTGWTDEQAIEEYEQFSKPKDRALDKAFIGRYDADVLKPLALERRMYRAKSFGDQSTKGSVYTAHTTKTDCVTEKMWDALDEEAKERLKKDREMLENSRLWSRY